MQVRAVVSFNTEHTGQDLSGTAGCGVFGFSVMLSFVIETLPSSTLPFLKGFSVLARLGDCVIGREDIEGEGDLDDEAREPDGLEVSIFLWEED